MAYANKYYDPVKAHEYYMRTRQLKGYANRYGGSRGNGTSAASGGIANTREAYKKEQESVRSFNDSLRENQEQIRKENSEKIQNLNREINELKINLARMSPEDRKLNSEAIAQYIQEKRFEINGIRDNTADTIQSLRQQTKGGSTSGFNEKGKQLAAKIKSSLEVESKKEIQSANKKIDEAMLEDVKRFYADVQAMRKNGRGFDRASIARRLAGFRSSASKSRERSTSQIYREYNQKYKDAVDELRKDNSNFSYYDKKREREERKAEQERLREIQKEEREKRRLEREQERESRKRERESRKRERESANSSNSSRSSGSSGKRRSSGKINRSNNSGSVGKSGSYKQFYRNTRGRDYVNTYR